MKKNNKIYIYPNQANSGFFFVVLGIMEIITKTYPNVKVFRPIYTEEKKQHDLFLQNYFHVDVINGISLEKAKHILATKGKGELYTALIEQYILVASQSDFVVIVGIESDRFENIVELDINIEIAKNFSSSVVHIINGFKKTKEELEDSCVLFEENLAKADLYKVATIINKTNYTFTRERTFFIPYIPELAQLSTADIARVLHQQIKQFRPIHTIQIAAQNVEYFLEHFSLDDLVIIPANRSDILVALIASFHTKTAPKPSAIILCDNQTLHPKLQQFLSVLKEAGVAVFAVKEDTLTIALKLSQIQPKIDLHDQKKIALALGSFYRYVDINVFQISFQNQTQTIITPQMFLYNIFSLARKQKKRVVLPEAHDKRILEAAEIILHQGIAEIILLSDEISLKKRCAKWGIKLQNAIVIDPKSQVLKKRLAEAFYERRKEKELHLTQAYDAMDHINYFATMMVYEGLADAMVSGATHSTAETIRPALEIIKTKQPNQKVSSIFFMCLDTRVLVFGDCAVIPEPTIDDLVNIAYEAACNAKKFGIDPKIAFISYSSGNSGSGKSVEKIKKALEQFQQKYPSFLADGPMQFDAAYDKTVAKQKLPHSQVAGEATVFIFPDLNTANTTYKAVQRSSNAIAIGPILQGLAKPINDLSRGCLVDDIVSTIAITAIQAQEDS